MDLTEMPEKFRPDWPENAEPTPIEWAGWYASLPFKWQVSVAGRVLNHQRGNTRCFRMGHETRIEELQSQVSRLLEFLNAPAPDDTPEAWLERLLNMSEEDRLTTAKAVLLNARKAWQCRADAHRTHLKKLREAMTAIDEAVHGAGWC